MLVCLSGVGMGAIYPGKNREQYTPQLSLMICVLKEGRRNRSSRLWRELRPRALPYTEVQCRYGFFFYAMGMANAHPSGRESHFFRPSPYKSSQQIYGNGHFIKTTEFETEGVEVREKRVMSDASDDLGEFAEDQVRLSLCNDDK